MIEQPSAGNGERELSPLTDSLASCIRWRLSDYEAMLRSEVELLLGAGVLSEDRRGDDAVLD